MPVFEMISYHNKKYPTDIPLHTEEIAGNLMSDQLLPLNNTPCILNIVTVDVSLEMSTWRNIRLSYQLTKMEYLCFGTVKNGLRSLLVSFWTSHRTVSRLSI